MSKAIRFLGSLLLFFLSWQFTTLPCHAQLTSIGILTFQDESDTNAPPGLLQKIRQEFKQKLTLSFKDVLPRLVSGEALGDPANASAEQLAAFGRQQGVKCVARGGLLALISERAGQDLKCHLELYAELVDTASGTVSSLRAEGDGIEPNSALDDARRWESYSWTSPDFSKSALGQALNAALASLTDQVHAAATSPAPQPQAETQPVQQEPAAVAPAIADQGQPTASVPSAASDAYQAGQELQQLIAQAESVISSGASSNLDTEPLRQCLESLRAAMANKLNLMQQGQDTTAVDQEIAQHKQELQGLVDSYTQQAAANPAQSASGQPQGGGSPDAVSRLNGLMDSTLGLLQRIQEVRAALGGSDQAQAAALAQPTDAAAGESAPPTEDQTSTVSGVISDNGTPVGDATVTDPQTGISTTTNGNGFYTLPDLPSGRVANLQVVRAGQMIAAGRVELVPGQAGISDWTLRPGTGVARPPASRIMPSTLIVAGQSGQAGTGGIQGIVRDGQGRPVSLALVSVNGVGMVRTNPQGRYMFANVPQGSYQVTVQQGGAPVQTQQVKVNVRQTAQVQMLYKNRGSSAGTMARTRMLVPGENTVLEGRISDEADQALGRAKVTVVYTGGALSVFSNESGAYRLRDLKQGEYRVLVAKPGYSEVHQSVSLRTGVPASRNFRLRRSSSPYVQQALANQKQGPASSKPVTGSTHPAYITKPATPSSRVSSGNAGNPVSKPAGSQTGPKTLEKPKSPAASVQPQSAHGTSQAQIAAGPGYVHGTVIDGKTKAPVAGATVSIKGKPSVQADGSGQFSFSDVAAGSRFIAVKKAGYMSGGGSVMIRTGQTVVVNLTLAPVEPVKKAPAATRPQKKLP